MPVHLLHGRRHIRRHKRGQVTEIRRPGQIAVLPEFVVARDPVIPSAHDVNRDQVLAAEFPRRILEQAIGQTFCHNVIGILHGLLRQSDQKLIHSEILVQDVAASKVLEEIETGHIWRRFEVVPVAPEFSAHLNQKT